MASRDPANPVPAVMAAIPEIAHRLQKGQQFNTYGLDPRGFAVCLGPITDALSIADVGDERVATMLEAALREMAGQRRFDHRGGR